MLRQLGVFALLLSAAGLMAAGSTADEKKDEKKKAAFAAKCPISGADAKQDQTAKYKEKNVYFCCGDCKGAFEKDSTKHATKANHQLVSTRQFRQAKCPLSGGELNKDQKASVNGVEVQFCCDKCKGKVEAAKGDDQIAMVFAEEAFKKGFVARKNQGKGKKTDEEKKAE